VLALQDLRTRRRASRRVVRAEIEYPRMVGVLGELEELVKL
jgi:hypothetical protein